MTIVYAAFEPRINLIQRAKPTPAINVNVFSKDEEAPYEEGLYWGRPVELYKKAGSYDEVRDGFASSAADTMVFAGRNCYNAFGRKNPATAENEDYLHNIIQQNHLSVMEHSSFTFLLENVSRSATHEIVRHRHLSFSQESQRYVGVKDEVTYVVPPAIAASIDDDDKDFLERGADHPIFDSVYEAVAAYHDTYSDLRDQGFNHKESAEAARSYLPNGIATTIVVTGNARSWMEFIQKRDAPGADKELQVIAQEISSLLEHELPEVFSPEARAMWPNNSEQKAVKNA